MRRQAYQVKWSIAGGHERQRVRRGLLVAAATDPTLTPVADALSAQDEAAQRARREQAIPQPRKFELVAAH